MSANRMTVSCPSLAIERAVLSKSVSIKRRYKSPNKLTTRFVVQLPSLYTKNRVYQKDNGDLYIQCKGKDHIIAGDALSVVRADLQEGE